MDDDVCWFPVVGGCNRAVHSVYAIGKKEISVCAYHAHSLEAMGGKVV